MITLSAWSELQQKNKKECGLCNTNMVGNAVADYRNQILIESASREAAQKSRVWQLSQTAGMNLFRNCLLRREESLIVVHTEVLPQ